MSIEANSTAPIIIGPPVLCVRQRYSVVS